MNASTLFANARKIPLTAGKHSCFYCGASCAEEFPVKQFVKGSFTGWSGVANPSADFVCGGCVASMDESAIVSLPNEVREGQRIRNYSWLITETNAKAFTKAHIAELRAVALYPPPPPFALIISDSGQKQLIYRAPVCLDARTMTVMLEDEPISYSIPQLQQMLVLCGKLIAGVGKPALKENFTGSIVRYILETWSEEGERLIEQWERVRQNPVARLALWLSDGKEAQRRVYGLD